MTAFCNHKNNKGGSSYNTGYLKVETGIKHRISILPKLIYKFNAIPIKISTFYFMDIGELLTHLYGGATDQYSIKGGLILSNFKTFHEATVIKTVWYW